MAAEPGYTRTSYMAVVTPTIDGMWTSEDEWTDTEATMIGEDVAFRSTWYFGDDVVTQWIIEFFSDTTDDSEDMWQFCIDGDQSGGASPQPSDYKFEITGHTDIYWELGDTGGSGEWMWTDVIPENEIEWANSLSASPTNSTPHWILEFQKKKNVGQIQLPTVWDFLLQVYDASNPGAGKPSWPPTNPNYREEYGIENYSSEPIPEGVTFAVMALLSTVSMLVGYKYLVKRKETKAQ